jgi:hypothetical protein
VGGQRHASAGLPLGKSLGTHCSGGWVFLRADVDGYGEEYNPFPHRVYNPLANLDLKSGPAEGCRSAGPDLWIRIHHSSNPETSSWWQVSVPTAMLEVCRPSQMFIQRIHVHRVFLERTSTRGDGEASVRLYRKIMLLNLHRRPYQRLPAQRESGHVWHFVVLDLMACYCSGRNMTYLHLVLQWQREFEKGDASDMYSGHTQFVLRLWASCPVWDFYGFLQLLNFEIIHWKQAWIPFDLPIYYSHLSCSVISLCCSQASLLIQVAKWVSDETKHSMLRCFSVFL